MAATTKQPGSSRVRLAEHLLSGPDRWQSAAPSAVELRGARLQTQRLEEGLLVVRLPWPAAPGSPVELRGPAGAVISIEAGPSDWTPVATSREGMAESIAEGMPEGMAVAFSPASYRLEAEQMQRGDSAEVENESTMASLITLPDGASLLASLPPLADGARVLVVARASGGKVDAAPLEAAVGLRVTATPRGADAATATPLELAMEVAEAWRPFALELPAGGAVLDLQLRAAVPEGSPDRRLVIKRLEVDGAGGDRLLLAGPPAALDAWAEALAEESASLSYRLAGAGPSEPLPAAGAFAWPDADCREHWVHLAGGTATFLASEEGLQLTLGDRDLERESPGGPWRVEIREPGLTRLRVRGADARAARLRLIQPEVAIERRQNQARLPEPLHAEAGEHLQRLELNRERKAAWVLSPGDTLRFTLPADAPSLLHWEHAAFVEGSAHASGQCSVLLRQLSEDGRELAKRQWPLEALGEKEAPWSAARWELETPGARILELSIEGEAHSLGEDGRLLTRFVALCPPTLVDPAERPGGVIVYCIDTLRADHLSLMGYERPTTPELQRLEDQLLIFEDAYSTCSWTRPATASILTGLHPVFHGASGRNVLATEVLTLAERLHDAGFATGAVVTNPNVSSRNLGFEEGFEDFHAAFAGGKDQLATDQFETMAASFHPWIEDWLARHAHEPFFLYVHSVDPHSPYTPPEDQWRRFDPQYQGDINGLTEGPGAFEDFKDPSPADIAHIEALYDAEIIENDHALALLERSLKDLQLWNQSALWLTSDHGEEFQERGGWVHGGRAWQEQVHVPFVLKPAAHWNMTPRRLRHRAQIADIAPTLCELLGASAGPAFSGDSLVSVLRGDAAEDADRSLWLDERPAVQTFLQGPHKLVLVPDSSSAAGTRFALFQLRKDPGELHDLGEEDPQTAAALRRRLDDHLALLADRGLEPAPVRGRAAVMSEEEINFLMAVGYLGD